MSVLRSQNVARLLLGASLAFFTLPVAALNTAEILSRTTKAIPSCLKWRVVGECFWLRCDLTGCSVRISAKVGHYRPDNVVSVYTNVEQHPWRELKVIVKRSFKLARHALPPRLRNVIGSGGGSPAPEIESSVRGLHFFEADVIGHPLQHITFPGANLICDAVTQPLIPYFISLTDAVAWRNPEVESYRLESLVPGRREVGNWPTNTWGAVFPRTGWIGQPSLPKAAAVVAQRAADVAINGGTLRVRQPMSGARVNLWPPYQLRENNSASAVWQMLHPRRESSCAPFGRSDLNSLADWGGGRHGRGNAFAWNLWRPYKCCIRRGQRFLGSDDFRSYP